MKRSNFLKTGIAVGLALTFFGCHPAPLVVPSYLQNVGVEIFQNQTSYYGLETIFTQAAIRGFQLDGRLALEDPEKSDLVVKVVVRKYIEEPLFFDTKTNNVLQYRLTVVYDLAAVDQREKKTFLEDKERAQSIFYYTPDYSGAISETKDQAIARLGDDLGRSIARRILTGY